MCNQVRVFLKMRIFLLLSDKGDFRISEVKELSVSMTDQMWPLGGTVYFLKNDIWAPEMQYLMYYAFQNM